MGHRAHLGGKRHRDRRGGNRARGSRPRTRRPLPATDRVRDRRAGGARGAVGHPIAISLPAPSTGRSTIEVRAKRSLSQAHRSDEFSFEAHHASRSLFGVGPPLQPAPSGRPPAADETAVQNRVLALATPLLSTFVPSALRSFSYVGANRHVDGSRYPLGADLPPRIVTAYDLVTTLAYRRDRLDRVSARCRAVFD